MSYSSSLCYIHPTSKCFVTRMKSLQAYNLTVEEYIVGISGMCKQIHSIAMIPSVLFSFNG